MNISLEDTEKATLTASKEAIQALFAKFEETMEKNELAAVNYKVHINY